MRITIAGGSGFLGHALVRALQDAKHEVTLLTRRPPDGTVASSGVAQRQWTPDGTAGSWVDAVDGSDAVINLAGESIASGSWTTARRAAILQSRLLSTRSLVVAIATAHRPPALLVNASASGYYGDRGDEILTEESNPGRDFLAGVCMAWEAEARKVKPTVRLAILRTGIVLSAQDGALPRMALPFKLYGGGPLGSGRQYMPWIHAEDWVRLVQWVLESERVEGPLNAAAPDPVRNATFAKLLGRALGKPSWVPAPAFALRLALGEMADRLLLSSAREVPERPRAHGFRFRFETAEDALTDIYRS